MMMVLSVVAMVQLVLTNGCSNIQDAMYESGSESVSNQAMLNNENMIDGDEAIQIANRIVSQKETRTDEIAVRNVEYICRQQNTRNLDVSDTIAYIVNYENENGFAIISADNRVFPILAYSHEGNFTLSNEIAAENFISNIESYIDNNSGIGIRYPELPDHQELIVVSPMVKCILGQKSPWDKYVVEEHPGCPVGCVALAAGTVISHAVKHITYHGEHFFLSSIISAISPDDNEDDKTDSVIVSEGILYPLYTYTTAADRMAKLLYWIGKDINTTYAPSGSSAGMKKPYYLCQDLHLSIPSGWASYDINEMTNYLQDDCIICMTGKDQNEPYGHVWVVDGCAAIVEKKNNKSILQTYIHCDWGWYGGGNGYFSGDVFSVKGSNYRPYNYFAVSRKPLYSPK